METINYNFFQLLILFGSIQGIIFCYIVFFVNKYQSTSSTFLGLTILFLSISNIQHILIDVNYFTATSFIKRAYIPWQWLVAPMFYLFAHSFLQIKELSTKMLYFLIAPFIIITVIHTLQLIYQIYFNPNHIITEYYQRGLFLYTNLLSFLYVPFVVYKMYQMVINYENNRLSTTGKTIKEMDWLKSLIHIGIGIISLGVLSIIIVIILNPKEYFYAYPFFISLSLWIYWVGYIGINKATKSKVTEKPNTIPIESSKKRGQDTFNKINEYIIKEKKYSFTDVNLNSIAEHFEISPGYLSKLINQHVQKRFNDYINELRINDAKKMLTHSDYKNYTIESIGIECGFRSKSNFYSTFKKITGYTPNQYKKLKE